MKISGTYEVQTNNLNITVEFVQAFMDECYRLGIVGYVMENGEKAYYRNRYPTPSEQEQLVKFEENWLTKQQIQLN